MFDYDFEDKLDLKILLAPLLAAENAIARLGERLRTLPFAEGVIERVVYFEASATRLLEGELVPVEDLVLLESGHSRKLSYSELSSCYECYIVLRHANYASPEPLLVADRPGEFEKSAIDPEKRSELIYDLNWDGPARLSAWRQARRDAEAYPPLLAAALVWDSWLCLEPDQHGHWRALLLAGLTLKHRKAFAHGLLPLAWGGERQKFRWLRHLSLNGRILGFLDYVVAGCTRVQREIDRLVLAAALIDRKLEGRRKNSRLPELREMFLRKPYVSLPMAAKALKISDEGARLLIKELGSAVREMTGKSSYRVWSI